MVYPLQKGLRPLIIPPKVAGVNLAAPAGVGPLFERIRAIKFGEAIGLSISAPIGCGLDPTNSKVIVSAGDYIYEFEFAVAGDISSQLTYTGNSLYVYKKPTGLRWSVDGLKLVMEMYLGRVRTYTFTTPFDLSSVSVGSTEVTIHSNLNAFSGVDISPDGLRFIYAKQQYGLRTYSLSVPFNMSSTVTLEHTHGGAPLAYAHKVVFNPTGDLAYISTNNPSANLICAYSCPDPWSMEGATELMAPLIYPAVTGIFGSHDRKVLFGISGSTAFEIVL